MKDEGVKSVYILDDAEVYGKGVAENTKTAAEKHGIKIAGEDSWDGKASNYRALASKIKASGADAVFTGGIIDNNGPQLYKDLQRGDAGRQAVRPGRRGDLDFTKEIPAKVQAQTYLTAPTVSPEELPPAGQQFYKDYEAEYGEPQDEIDPYAVYGYEAMAVVFDAIAQGGDDRQAVIDAFFATKGRESPLGTYDIDADGDTTLTDYGATRPGRQAGVRQDDQGGPPRTLPGVRRRARLDGGPASSDRPPDHGSRTVPARPPPPRAATSRARSSRGSA